MRKEINVCITDPLILECTDLVYEQKPYWCNATRFPLKMSILHPRSFFDYDSAKTQRPCIVMIAGGGWTEVDQNVWMPELVYYAKHGYVVASVSYSLPPTWLFPEMLCDIKQAIRFLRAHAEEWGIDSERIAVMGESAGGHLASLVATTEGVMEFEKGDYLEQKSNVQAAVIFYGASDLTDFEGRGETESYNSREQILLRGEFEPQSIAAGVHYLRDHPDIAKAMDPTNYISQSTPPFLLLHGLKDKQVPVYHSEIMYKKLLERKVAADIVLIKDVDHASQAFIQTEVKEMVLGFLDKSLNKL